MRPGTVRNVAAVLAVVLTTGCGAAFEDLRPDRPMAEARAPGASVVVIPRKPRARPGPTVSEAALRDTLQWMVTEVRIDGLRAEWRRIAQDVRFHPLRAEAPQRPYRLMLASWSPRESALQAITHGYQQWCSVRTRLGSCIILPMGRTSLDEAEVYQVAFDFAMGARWDGFTHELKGMLQPSTIRIAILTGLVIFMACVAIPELTSKIPVALATALLTAYLGAQAVCALVFGWLRMVRDVDAATSFEQVRDAGERYGEAIGAETARILVMVAMAAISEGGVVAKLMRLPQAAEASAALAEDTGGVGLESIGSVSDAKVLQGGVSITVEGVAQGTLGVAMGARGGAPKVRTLLPLKPPSEPVDLKLTYKEGWTAQQRADARAKVKMLDEADDKVVVKGTKRKLFRARATFMGNGDEIPPGCDLDHCVDLQLNGKDTLGNMWPLDSSVNRSLGAKIQHAIKDLPAGTRIGRVTIE